MTERENRIAIRAFISGYTAGVCDRSLGKKKVDAFKATKEFKQSLEEK